MEVFLESGGSPLRSAQPTASSDGTMSEDLDRYAIKALAAANGIDDGHYVLRRNGLNWRWRFKHALWAMPTTSTLTLPDLWGLRQEVFTFNPNNQRLVVGGISGPMMRVNSMSSHDGKLRTAMFDYLARVILLGAPTTELSSHELFDIWKEKNL